MLDLGFESYASGFFSVVGGFAPVLGETSGERKAETNYREKGEGGGGGGGHLYHTACVILWSY